MKPSSCTTYGKWILAGEHAVLRGHPALAFPLLTKSLRLEFEPEGEELDVRFAGPHGEEYSLLFYGVLENALRRLHVHDSVRGRVLLTSDLPVGAGLGASAALCGAVSRWGEAQGLISSQEVYEFARRLEDLFHGESSGVDLAVALSGRGVRFTREGGWSDLKTTWWPEFLYLSYCGRRGMTSDCVNKVKGVVAADPEMGRGLDGQMGAAVAMAEEALTGSPAGGFGRLRAAISMARECFVAWGLCGGDLGAHMASLEAAGAAAVKPTGSGGGGYCLSLWDRNPPLELAASLIPVPHPAAD